MLFLKLSVCIIIIVGLHVRFVKWGWVRTKSFNVVKISLTSRRLPNGASEPRFILKTRSKMPLSRAVLWVFHHSFWHCLLWTRSFWRTVVCVFLNMKETWEMKYSCWNEKQHFTLHITHARIHTNTHQSISSFCEAEVMCCVVLCCVLRRAFILTVSDGFTRDWQVKQSHRPFLNSKDTNGLVFLQRPVFRGSHRRNNSDGCAAMTNGTSCGFGKLKSQEHVLTLMRSPVTDFDGCWWRSARTCGHETAYWEMAINMYLRRHLKNI